MPSLLSGSVLRSGGSGDFLKLEDAMPQLPATDTTLTGFTIATDPVLRTSYRSSLGFVQFHTSTMYSLLPDGMVRVAHTGSTFMATSTQTGTLVVTGGVAVGANMHVEEDIVVNGITIGTGWEGQNNIVMRGTAVPPANDFLNGQESIAIGYDTLLGLSTSYKNIAIGRFTLNSGTKISNSIAIGDSALKSSGWGEYSTVGGITNATQANPVVVTVANHNLSTGTKITINGVVGMVELNTNEYYVNVLSSSTLALYVDATLFVPVDGNVYTAYATGGTLGRLYKRNNNIAIGNNAAEKFLDGEKNFFFGDQIAKNLITGSNNFYIGSDVGTNMTKASGVISIGSDNLVDGRDNQVAIGSVFYYNGTGSGTLNANFQIGIGMQSTSTNSGGLTVIGGAGIERNLYVGEKFSVVGTSSFASDVLPANGNVSLGSTSSPFKSLYLQGTTLYLSTVTLQSTGDRNFTVSSPAGAVRQVVGDLTLNSGLGSSGYASGSLIVTGGAGIAGDVFVNGSFNVLGVENVDISPAGGDVYLQPTLGGTINITASTEGDIDNMRIGQSNAADANFVNVQVQSSTTASSSSTGALTVEGGVGIKGVVYAKTGNPDENYLLYTPRSTVSTTPPVGARVGDFWINPTGPYFLQYVNDGGNKIWVQI